MTQSYITTGLTYASGVSFYAGGYVRIGDIVIVNIRVSISANISANTHIIKGLPAPAVNERAITVTNNTGNSAMLEPTGEMYCSGALTSGGAFIAGCVYIAS